MGISEKAMESWRLHTAAGNMTQHSHHGGERGKRFLKVKPELPYEPVMPLLDMHSEELQSEPQSHTRTLVFVVTTSQQLKCGSDPCPATDAQVRDAVHIQYNATQLEK